MVNKNIAEEVLKGHTFKQIADILGLSESAVSRRTKSIAKEVYKDSARITKRHYINTDAPTLLQQFSLETRDWIKFKSE